MSIYVRLMDKINSWLKVLLVALLSITLFSLTLQVVFRVLDIPLSWSEELARYLVIWSTFIGASIAVRYQKLIKLEGLLFLLPTTFRRLFAIIAGIISIIFYILLIYFGIKIMGVVQLQESPSLQLSMAIPYAAIPVGSLLLILNTIASLIDSKGADES